MVIGGVNSGGEVSMLSSQNIMQVDERPIFFSSLFCLSFLLFFSLFSLFALFLLFLLFLLSCSLCLFLFIFHTPPSTICREKISGN